MNVLLTGAFGNIGKSTLVELLRRGHTVRCFDIATRANERFAQRYQAQFGDQIEVVWGDLRRAQDLVGAVQNQQVVVHLAFIIPKMSVTGVESEQAPDWAREINVGGTHNLLQAIEAQSDPPKIIFASSYHVFGRTQHLPPPRTVLDPVDPVEHYTRHKIECERMVQALKSDWAIFRLSAAMPFAIKLDPGMFDVPLDNRMEFVHSRDVALAIANALETDAVWGRLLLIGGGARCQYRFREIVERILGAMGLGMLPEEAFSTLPFCTDWVDTTISQKLLRYQTRDIDDYVREMKTLLGFRILLIRLFRPLVRQWVLSRSPYYRRRSSTGRAALREQPAQPTPLLTSTMPLTPEIKALFTETARTLKGKARLLFMARAVEALGEGGTQKAEQELGWARKAILSGMRELRGKMA
ncbi:MAG: NAD(P)-dependent oxidoreductase [Anaerolineae bacterium]|nr:NAD(P)-dependent oxidoreductase [Anaerolineae bacterium]